MTVCNFFLQGRCRYGDKCWNEHPRGGGGGGGGGRGGGGGGGGYNNNNYNRSHAQQQQPRGGGGGGFGNRVWVNPSQQKAGYIQPSSFSSHGTEEWGRGGAGSGGADWGRAEGGGGAGENDWGRGGGGGGGGGGAGENDWGRGGGGGGGRRDNNKSSEFSFSAQNRYSTLGTPSTFDRGGRGEGQQVTAGEEDDDKKLEIIQMDMDVWETSGQWAFSCYSSFKTPLSGFTDLSPEELRLEYFSTRASGDLQSYVNGINQLLNQWRSRVQELKVMNPATRTALLAEINNPAPQAPPSGFGSVTGFGSSAASLESKGFGAPAPAQANTFSFAAPSGGFGSSAAPSSSAGFGTALAAPTQPPSGFGSSTAASSSSFSFAVPSTNKPEAPSGFGSASGFNFSSTTNTGGGFGSGFGAAPAAAGSGSGFGQASGGFGTAAAPPAAGGGSAGGDSLFSHQSNMTPEELNQFKAKRFTLGQIPLKPPPADMLALAKIKNPAPQAPPSGFGSVTGFGSSAASLESKGFGAPAPAQANTFSFAAPSGGFGSSAAPSSSTGFGTALAAPTQPPSGFGSSTAASSSSFSFAVPSTNKPAAPSGFGSASGFKSSTTKTKGGFWSSFGAVPAAAGSGSVLGQASGGFGTAAAPPAAGAGSAGGDSLFSHESNMTPEELNQFKAKRVQSRPDSFKASPS